jgi:hypothetical protein
MSAKRILKDVTAHDVARAEIAPNPVPSESDTRPMSEQLTSSTTISTKSTDAAPTPTSPAWYLRRKMISRMSITANIVTNWARVLTTFP